LPPAEDEQVVAPVLDQPREEDSPDAAEASSHQCHTSGEIYVRRRVGAADPGGPHHARDEKVPGTHRELVLAEAKDAYGFAEGRVHLVDINHCKRSTRELGG